MDTTTVEHRPDEHRFEIHLDGEVAGFTTYRAAPGVRAFLHTEVDDRFAGRGLASQLVEEALAVTRTEGLEVQPFCPYVRNHIRRHPELLDLVAESQRARFDLA